MTRLIVWRHGLTEWNARRRVQGQFDAELNEEGRAQAAAAAGVLAALGPEAIYSSDLRRAADTAAALAELTGLPVKSDPRLRERYYGQWQGLPMDEITRRWPAEHARWLAGDPSPGCDIEHNDDLGRRVAATLREIAERHPGATVVATTHGGSARHGTAWLLGWPPALAYTLGGLANCRWTELTKDRRGGWQLRSHNTAPMRV